MVIWAYAVLLLATRNLNILISIQILTAKLKFHKKTTRFKQILTCLHNASHKNGEHYIAKEV